MWLKYPTGTERISVEQQNYEVEVRDEKNNGYGRVPNALVARLVNLGFHKADPPEGAPADLPLADPLRDGAISDLTVANEQLRKDAESLRSDMGAANAKIGALVTERDKLLETVKTLETKLAEKADEEE